MGARGRRAEGISCGFTYAYEAEWRSRAWGDGRPPGEGAEEGGRGPQAFCCPLPSAVPSTGPLSSGHPERPLRLWVKVNRGFITQGHPDIGARLPPYPGPYLLGLLLAALLRPGEEVGNVTASEVAASPFQASVTV